MINTRSASLKYRWYCSTRARLNELLSVSAEVVKIGRASVVFRQRVERSGELLVEAEVTLAVVDKGRMKPARMPVELEKALN